jgi:hypothetical protein
MSEAVINDSAKKSVQDLSSLALGDAGDSSKSTHSGEDKVVWYKRIEQSLSNWIQAWNPYDPKKLQCKGLKPV